MPEKIKVDRKNNTAFLVVLWVCFFLLCAWQNMLFKGFKTYIYLLLSFFSATFAFLFARYKNYSSSAIIISFIYISGFSPADSFKVLFKMDTLTAIFYSLLVISAVAYCVKPISFLAPIILCVAAALIPPLFAPIILMIITMLLNKYRINAGKNNYKKSTSDQTLFMAVSIFSIISLIIIICTKEMYDVFPASELSFKKSGALFIMSIPYIFSALYIWINSFLKAEEINTKIISVLYVIFTISILVFAFIFKHYFNFLNLVITIPLSSVIAFAVSDNKAVNASLNKLSSFVSSNYLIFCLILFFSYSMRAYYFYHNEL